MQNKNMIKYTLGLLMAGASFLPAKAQLGTVKETFTRADTLRGSLTTPLRTCYDINYYHLDVKFDVDKKFISGNVLFKFTAVSDFDKLQFDLWNNLKIEKVVYKGQELKYTREFNAVFLTFPKILLKVAKMSLPYITPAIQPLQKKHHGMAGLSTIPTRWAMHGYQPPARVWAPAYGGQQKINRKMRLTAPSSASAYLRA
jgi:hypothetical protein